MISLKKARRLLDKKLDECRHARRRVMDEKEALAKAEKQSRHVEKALEILQHVAQQVQQQAHHSIAAVVTRCLEAVFDGEGYEFGIDFQKKRGKTEARLLFKQNGNEFDPLKEGSGGVIDIAALALRMACLNLYRPAPRKFMILDEPFRFMDQDKLPAVQNLLLTLSKEMGVQFLIVTHSDELKIGKVIKLGEHR